MHDRHSCYKISFSWNKFNLHCIVYRNAEINKLLIINLENWIILIDPDNSKPC